MLILACAISRGVGVALLMQASDATGVFGGARDFGKAAKSLSIRIHSVKCLSEIAQLDNCC